MFNTKDVKRIIAKKQFRLDQLSNREVWDRHTKHMECGEHKDFKQSCIDDEIVIEILQKNISVKPVLKDRFDYCPVCGKMQKTAKRGKRKPWYCERCGQKLSWDGDNNAQTD